MNTTKTKQRTMSQRVNGAHRGGTPLVAISTPDAQATIEEIVKGFDDAGAKLFYTWDPMRGLLPQNDAAWRAALTILGATKPEDSEIASQTSNPIEFLNFIYNMSMGVPFDRAKPAQFTTDRQAVIFAVNLNRYCLGYRSDNDAPSATTTQAVTNLRDALKRSGSMLVMLSAAVTFDATLKADCMIFDQPLPDDAELARVFNETLADFKDEHKTEAICAQAVNALRGCTAFAAEGIIAANARPKTGVDLDGIWESKISLINATKGLEYQTGDDSFDKIGGLDAVKEFFTLFLNGQEPAEVIVWIDEIEKAFGGVKGDNTGTAQDFHGTILSFMEDYNADGIILVGHPGTGKSAVAKASGSVTGKPVIKLDLNGMKESLLGASGSNLRAALKVLYAISGGRMLFVATSNGIETLSPELRARFSLPTFFFKLPTDAERQPILDVWMRRYGLTDQPTRKMTGWVGREIKVACKNAWKMRVSIDAATRWAVPSFISGAKEMEQRQKEADGKFLCASTGDIYRDEPLPTEFTLPAAEPQAASSGRRRIK